MDGRTEYVKNWIWVDYDLPGWRRYQVLVTDETALIISNTVAVALTLSLPRLLIFVKLLLPNHTRSQLPRELIRTGPSPGNTNLVPLAELAPGVENVENIAEESSDNPLPLASTFESPRPIYNPHSSSRITSGIGRTFQEASSFENAVARLGRSHLAMGRVALGDNNDGIPKKWTHIINNFREDTWGFALVTALMLGLFGLFLGEQIVAISAAGIVSGSYALSASPNCGWWTMKNMSDFNPSIGNISYILQFHSRSMLRAISYAETCYGENAVAESCNIFYNTTISYSVTHNTSCPFSGHTCLEGDSSAYTLDTGFVDYNVLGINAELRFQFRRKLTCSPLVTNDSYLQYFRDEKNNSWVGYRYGKYGASSFSLTQPTEFTYTEDVRRSLPHYWYEYVRWRPSTIDQFLMILTDKYRVQEASYLRRDPNGVPSNPPSVVSFLPEFQVIDSTVTLIFIRPKLVAYSARSDDPIFPAEQEIEDPWGRMPGKYFVNLRPHASVLACVDTAEFRDPATGDVRTPDEYSKYIGKLPLQTQAKFTKGLTHLRFALAGSNIYTSVGLSYYRFDAQKKLYRGFSIPLEREQWKVEARQIFETALARMQVNVHDIARGIGWSELEARRDFYWDEFKDLCSMTKIQTQGWTNISLFWLVILPTLALSLWILTIEVGERIILISFYLFALKPLLKLLYFFLISVMSWTVIPAYRKLRRIRWRETIRTLTQQLWH